MPDGEGIDRTLVAARAVAAGRTAGIARAGIPGRAVTRRIAARRTTGIAHTGIPGRTQGRDGWGASGTSGGARVAIRRRCEFTRDDQRTAVVDTPTSICSTARSCSGSAHRTKGCVPCCDCVAPDCVCPNVSGADAHGGTDRAIIVGMRYLRIIPVVAAACGGNGGGGAGHLIDASALGDGSLSSEFLPLPVTLTILHNGLPVVGVHTYFLNADSSVVATVDTDTAGTAHATMTDGGSVTALDPFAPAQPDPLRVIQLRTYAGVKAGDQLTMSQNDPAEISVTINAPMLTGRHDYDVLTTCGTASLGSVQSTGTITLRGCNGIADILVAATDRAVGATDNFAMYRADVAVADGTTVDLTTETFEPQRDVTFHYSHLPSDATGVSAFHGFATAHGTMGVSTGAFEGDTRAIANGEATVTFQVPNIAGPSALLDYLVDTHGLHDVVERRELAASYELDMAGAVLPGWTTLPHYDAASRHLTWTEAPGNAVPDLLVGGLSVTPAMTQATQARPTQRWSWQLVAPYTAGELQFPTLPTDVFDWQPGADDTVGASAFPFKAPGGFDALRGRLFDEVGFATFEQMQAIGAQILHTET
ncbi:MAG: hypothetical protein ABIY55_06820 [Kofleriaceae bacterium]